MTLMIDEGMIGAIMLIVLVKKKQEENMFSFGQK